MKTTLQWGSKKNYRPNLNQNHFDSIYFFEALCNFSQEIATKKHKYDYFWQSYFYWQSVTTVLVGIKMKLVHCDGNRLYQYHGGPYTTTCENSILKIIVSSCTTHHQRCCQTFVVISFFLTNTLLQPVNFFRFISLEDTGFQMYRWLLRNGTQYTPFELGHHFLQKSCLYTCHRSV